jgi:hypothetical protein
MNAAVLYAVCVGELKPLAGQMSFVSEMSASVGQTQLGVDGHEMRQLVADRNMNMELKNLQCQELLPSNT